MSIAPDAAPSSETGLLAPFRYRGNHFVSDFLSVAWSKGHALVLNTIFPRRFVILRHDVPGDAVARVAAGRDPGPSRDAHAESRGVPGSFLSASHWDWMFEPWGLAAGEAKMLWTWATPMIFPNAAENGGAAEPHAVPVAGNPSLGRTGLPLERTFESDAVRLADHRPAYLNYEGPVSRGRGDVTRLLSGTYEMAEPGLQREPTATMRLAWFDPESGRERFGRLVLQRRWDVLSDDDPARAVWRLRFSPTW